MRPTRQLLYFVYGGAQAYRQELKFSLLSVLHWRQQQDITIRILTDRPQDYRGWPVEVLAIEGATLKAWQGQHGYLHRSKACAIAWALPRAGKTLFLDSDTVVQAPLAPLFDGINDQHGVMDVEEWPWRKARSRPEFARFAAALAARGQEPAEDTRLYNSGVCGLARTHLPRIERAIALIDDWHGHDEEVHTLEQIALSFSLADLAISEARGSIRHYYAEKRFLHFMLAHFFERYGEDYSPTLQSSWQEVPLTKPLPDVWTRLRVKWQLAGLDKQRASLGRKLLYGCLATQDSYARACRHVWWERALSERLGGGDRQAFAEGIWPNDLPRPHLADEASAALDYLRKRVRG